MRPTMAQFAFGLLALTPCASCTNNAVEEAAAKEPPPALTALSAAPDSATQRAILSARDAIWRAWFAHDTAQLQLLLPEAVAAGGDDPSAQRWADRALTVSEAKQFVEAGGILRTLAFPRTEIHVMGDVAVVFSDFEVGTAVHGSEHVMRGRSTEVFVLRNGRWINPFWHLGSL